MISARWYYAAGWLMRFAEGHTKRANSVNAWRPEAGRFEEVLDLAATFYHRRNLPLTVRLTPLADDAAAVILARRGAAPFEESLVLEGAIASGHAIDPGADLSPVPTPQWLGRVASLSAHSPETTAILGRLSGMILPEACFATIMIDGAPAACGLAVVERGWVGCNNIVTAPALRGRGIGRRLMATLHGWAASRGATRAYIQVLATNEPAVRLYRSLGLTTAYRYTYHRLGA